MLQVVARIKDDLSTQFEQSFPLERAHVAIRTYRSKMGAKLCIAPQLKA